MTEYTAIQDARDISTAPRDGRFIEIFAQGFGPFRMRWNCDARHHLMGPLNSGMWQNENATLEWSDDDQDGPTHWRPIGYRSAGNLSPTYLLAQDRARRESAAPTRTPASAERGAA